jgi:hypothetical protein
MEIPKPINDNGSEAGDATVREMQGKYLGKGIQVFELRKVNSFFRV